MTLKSALLILGGVTLLAGLIVGIVLVSQQQLIGKKAAVTTGQAAFKLNPATATLNVGDEVTVSGVLNTGSAQVSTYQILASYTYTDATPPISVVGNLITLTEPFFADSQCPAHSVTDDTTTKTITIKVTCSTGSPTSPYSTAGQDKTIFTFKLKGDAAGSITVSFDPLFSKVTLASQDITDVLTVPASATYTVSGTAPTPTPSPELTATPAPGTNSCGGTCGSNTNCNSDLFCYQGYCRKAACPTDTTCSCSSLPTATPAPSSDTGNQPLPQSGSATATWALVGTGILLIVASLGILF